MPVKIAGRGTVKGLSEPDRMGAFFGATAHRVIDMPVQLGNVEIETERGWRNQVGVSAAAEMPD